MRHRKLMAAVLSLAVILGVVSCKQQRDTEIGKDDNEITSTAQAILGETNPVSEEDNASEQAPAPDLDGTYNSELEIVEFTTSETTSEEMTSAKEQTTSHSAKHSDEPISNESLKETEAPKATATPKPTSAPKATNTAAPTATPVPTEIPKATNTPTPTPVPTSTPTPVPTSTPTPVPTPFDINQSARDNGYEIIDIDMGGGQTQRIYGYYVDMSELDNMSNDYRESLGLPRLPKDTNHIEEMKIRAAEITLPNHFYHKRPNGKAAKESNIVSGTDPRDCYERLFNSPGHRAAWEDPYATTLYSVGFRQMEFNTETGKWSEGSGATVQYLDYSL